MNQSFFEEFKHNHLVNNRYFILSHLFFLALGVYLFFSYDKFELHLLFNRFHTPFFDQFFKHITFIGDGLFIVILALILLAWRTGASVLILSSWAISGILAQGLKKLVFTSVVRPVVYFNGLYDLHLVEGVEMAKKYSFPSGHSTTAFALFFCIALMSRNHLVKFLCLLAAVVVAYSRVYLSQHFFSDIFAGSILGVIVAYLCFYCYERCGNDWKKKPIWEILKANFYAKK